MDLLMRDLLMREEPKTHPHETECDQEASHSSHPSDARWEWLCVELRPAPCLSAAASPETFLRHTMEISKINSQYLAKVFFTHEHQGTEATSGLWQESPNYIMPPGNKTHIYNTPSCHQNMGTHQSLAE